MSGGAPDIGGFFPPIGDDLGDGLAEDLRARVKAELEPGERLLWAARSSPPPQPMGPAYFVWSAIALFLFFLGTVIIVIAQSRTRWFERDNPTPLGIMLDIVCALIIAGVMAKLFMKRSERIRQSGVCYAITDRRAISWTPEKNGGAVRVRSIHRGRFKDIARVERPDGTGTLEFTDPPRDIDYPWNNEEFKHIPEVRRAEQIVRHYLIAPETTA